MSYENNNHYQPSPNFFPEPATPRAFSSKQLAHIEELKKCDSCKDVEDMEYELLEDGAPHHGADAICGECGANYYKEWGTEDILANNEQAKLNHPKLKSFPF